MSKQEIASLVCKFLGVYMIIQGIRNCQKMIIDVDIKNNII